MMDLATMAAVAGGGFVGAPSRYLVDRAVTSRVESSVPWGTFLVNLSGSFVLGFLTALVVHGHLRAVPSALLTTGFCGAYTTFSTFTYETLVLVEAGELREAAVNVGGSVVLGLVAAGVGFALGQLV